MDSTQNDNAHPSRTPLTSTLPTRTPSSSSSASVSSISPAPTLVGGTDSRRLSATPSLRSFFAFKNPSPSSPSPSPRSGLFPSLSRSLTRGPSAPAPGAPSSTRTPSLDSIWLPDFESHWQWRQREDARRLAEVRGSSETPYLTFGGWGRVLGVHARGVESGRGRRRVRVAQGGEGEEGAVGMGSSASAMGREETASALAAEEEEEEPKRRYPFFEWVEHNRREIRRLMRLKRLHLIIIGLVAFDLVIVIVELIVALLTAGCMTEEVYEYVLEAVEHSHGLLTPASFACTMAPSHSREALESAIFGINLALLSVFMTEVCCAIYAFGPVTYVTSWVTLLDGFVVTTTLVLDVYFHTAKDPAAKSPIAVVILRLWKIFRAIHAIGHALSLHFNEMMEASEEGRKKLELERVTESIRLNYVRNALIRATGHDVDPVLIEDEVQRERAAIERKRREEEERVYLELRSGSMFRMRSRHGGINSLRH
ncbi:hypothetical protein JCM6882_000523 [Rhodosporidiobolus microsporus]